MDPSGNLLLPLAIYRPIQHLVETSTQMDSNKYELATQRQKYGHERGLPLGMHCSIIDSNHQNMSNIYGFSSNVDWSTHNRKKTKAKHKDVIVNKLFDAANVNHNKAIKTLIKTRLAYRKANIKDATQTQKRTHPEPQEA
jgi:hypothetical protein